MMNNSKTMLLSLPTIFALFLTVAVSGVSQAGEKNADETTAPLMNIKVSPYTKRPPENKNTVAEGRAIYEKACIFCHGVEGAGDGPVATYLSKDMAPQPRDFTSGMYKFRSTASGELPMNEDLFRTRQRSAGNWFITLKVCLKTLRMLNRQRLSPLLLGLYLLAAPVLAKVIRFTRNINAGNATVAAVWVTVKKRQI